MLSFYDTDYRFLHFCMRLFVVCIHLLSLNARQESLLEWVRFMKICEDFESFSVRPGYNYKWRVLKILFLSAYFEKWSWNKNISYCIKYQITYMFKRCIKNVCKVQNRVSKFTNGTQNALGAPLCPLVSSTWCPF